MKFGSTFIGVILIAIYTANVASVLTTGDLNSRIMGPQDLIGLKVGSNYGSTAADYVARYGGMKLVVYPTSHDAYYALRDGQVAAIILDYPVLVYYSRVGATPGMVIIDSNLEYDNIGLAMRQNSSLISNLNSAILGLTQTGYSTQLVDKWIGSPKRSTTQAYDFYDTSGLWIWMSIWCLIAIGAFVLKKYVIKKRYKHLPWYSKLGGEDEAIEEARKHGTFVDGDTTPLLTAPRPQAGLSSQTLASYSEGEETDSDSTRTDSARPIMTVNS